MKDWLMGLNMLGFAAVIAVALSVPPEIVPPSFSGAAFLFSFAVAWPWFGRWWVRGAIAANLLILAVQLWGLVWSIEHGNLLVASLFCLPVATLCIINIIGFWPRAIAKPAAEA